MSEVSDEYTKKLSEAITENDEIINDVNVLIKEMKAIKDVDNTIYEKYKEECNNLVEDLDEITEILESCKQEDDPTLKSFDSKKKTAKASNAKSKKLMMDALLKLEKTFTKNKEAELKKKKGIIKTDSKKENEEKDKRAEKVKIDVDATSIKSAAGGSAVEDLEEIEEDIESDLANGHDDKTKKDLEKIKNSKNVKDKKKTKDKSNNKDEDQDKTTDKVINKKNKTDKQKKTKGKEGSDKADKKEILQDEASENSIPDEVEKSKNSSEKKTDKVNKPKITEEKKEDNSKTGDKSLLNKKHISEDEDKDKKKYDKKKGNDIKSGDDESDDYEENVSVKDFHADEKPKDKKKKGKTTSDDTQSIDSKNDTNVSKLKNKTDPKSKDKKSKDNESIGDQNDDSLVIDTKKKEKKKSKDKTTDDSESIHDKKDLKSKDKKSKDNESIGDQNDDSLVIDTKKKEKKKSKDKTVDDSESIHDKKDNSLSKEKKSEKKKDKEIFDDSSKKEDKKPKERHSILKSTKSPKKSEDKSDGSIPTLRTQDSIKSESNYDEDFESEEEEEELVKDGIIAQKVQKTQSKPGSSLQRQQLVESDKEETSSNRTEGELLTSTTFKHIEGFYVATKAFTGECEDDLSGHVGEKFTILETNDDGWWLARNENGDKGCVPISCLTSTKETKQLLDSKHDEESSEQIIISKDAKMEASATVDNEGKRVWDQIQHTMKEKSNEDQKGLTDTLKAFGGLPAGFRFSTLAIWSNKEHLECSMKFHLCPKLSDSDLSFKDLQHDSVENKIRLRPVRIQRTVQIVKSFQMPATNEKFVVKSRHVRMCLFNGEKAISNIHTMRASVADKDLKTWNFNSKITDSTNSLDFNEIFLRINHTSTDISILMEFCMLGFKSKNASIIPPAGSEGDNHLKKTGTIKIIEEFNDDELIEFSCGWTKVPLYEENGQLITAKSADYELFGGTPYEDGLEVDPTIGRTATGGKFKSLLNQSKQPQVSVRIAMPNKDSKDLVETLPDTIIGSTLHLTNISFYRRILSEELMDRRLNLTSAEPIYSPFLVSFMGVSDHPDLLDALRTVWIDKIKTLKNLDKKDYGKMNKVFQDTYMEYIYPISKLTFIKKVGLAHQDIEENRAIRIKEFIQRVKKDKLSVLLSGEYVYAPISFEEFSFKVVTKYSKSIKI